MVRLPSHRPLQPHPPVAVVIPCHNDHREGGDARTLTALATRRHDTDGCLARHNRTRRAEGIDGVRHRLQPGAYGHAPISQAPTHWRGADQLSGCAAMAQHAKHRNPLTSVDRPRHPTASSRAARRETTAQERPMYDHTPASIASTVGTPRGRRLTSCHSPKSLKTSKSVE